MTGRIISLNRQDSSGYIDAENGSRFRFHLSSRVAYDLNRVAPGQPVTFDLHSVYLHPPEAINVAIRAVSDTTTRQLRPMPKMRYVGFETKDNIRTYVFEQVVYGDPTRRMVVRVDLRLLTLHHVSIQDCLDICCQMILTANDSTDFLSLECELRERDLIEYLANKPVPAKSRSGIRKVAHPGVV